MFATTFKARDYNLKLICEILHFLNIMMVFLVAILAKRD